MVGQAEYMKFPCGCTWRIEREVIDIGPHFCNSERVSEENDMGQYITWLVECFKEFLV